MIKYKDTAPPPKTFDQTLEELRRSVRPSDQKRDAPPTDEPTTTKEGA